ncbi:MAG TPA: hypothetical protein VFL36_02305 [Myxococcales bacterium]|nr:hypothetical protein [Myxococcales bacterium]
MKRRRDLWLLAAAALLLIASAIYIALSARSAEERREATLERVPQFPAPNQLPSHRRRTRDAPPPPPPAPPPAAPAPRYDPMLSFALGGGSGNVGLVHVNALLNTPLFDRLRECMPQDFAGMDKAGRELGFDFSRDVDRIAFVPGGMAMSGFFEGKPVAQSMAGADSRRDDYRGAAIYTRPGGGDCFAQLSSLVLYGQGEGCQALVDRALSPTPAAADEDVYGDLFLRTDLAPFRQGQAAEPIRTLVDGLSGLTVRANVWDSVALTLSGAPQPGRDVRDLAQMARGAIALVKNQLDDDAVEYRALADLAKVGENPDRLEIDLALPAQDLFDKLHFPCPGRDAGM